MMKRVFYSRTDTFRKKIVFSWFFVCVVKIFKKILVDLRDENESEKDFRYFYIQCSRIMF